MSRFFSALNVVFSEGCGISLEEVLADEQFNARLRKELARSQSLSPKSDLGVAYHLGIRQMGLLLNTKPLGEAMASARELHPNFRDGERDKTARVLLSCLGEKLVESATETLPLIVKQLAEKWGKSTIREKLIIAESLVFLLRASREQNVDSLVDRANQPRERVLPFAYCEEGIEPNCLGKTQMVAAFARLCGTEAYLVTPLQCAGEWLAWKRRELVMATMKVMYLAKLAGTKIVTDSLMNIANDWRYQMQLLNYPHYAVVMKLTERRWLLVDTNFNIVTDVGHCWDMKGSTELLKCYQDVLPGLSVGMEYQVPALPPRIQSFRSIVELALDLEDLLRNQIKAENPIALVYERLDRAAEHPAFAFVARHSPFKSVFEENSHDSLCAYASSLTDLTEERARELGALDEEVKPLDELTKEEFTNHIEMLRIINEGVLSIPAMVLLTGIEKTIKSRQKRLKGVYPRVQITNLEFGLAVATLSHVGVDLGFEESVEAQLYRVAWDHYRLHNMANLPLRQNGMKNALSEHASRALKQLPFSLTVFSISLDPEDDDQISTGETEEGGATDNNAAHNNGESQTEAREEVNVSGQEEARPEQTAAQEESNSRQAGDANGRSPEKWGSSGELQAMPPADPGVAV